MMLAVSDIGQFPLVLFAQMKFARNRSFEGRTHSSVTSIAISGQLVWASQALSSRPGGHRAVADLVRIAEFVEIEQFRRQRFAAGVPLTFVLVDVYFQFSGHRRRFPQGRARLAPRALRSIDFYFGGGHLAAACKLYHITFAPAAAVK